MKPYLRAAIAIAGATLALALAATARAQDAPSGVFDRGRLITYQGSVPIASERFEYSRQGDSLVVSAGTERRRRMPDGTEKRISKAMTLYARADDFGMLRYVSNETADGRTIVRSIEPGDTSITVSTEIEGVSGGADMVDRPPGRFFAVDPGLFTLFDVIGRNLQHRIFGSRAVQLVVLGDNTKNVEAKATLAGADTVVWGGRRVVTERIALRDSTSAFTLWLSPEGHLLRLESEDGRLVVMREPPAVPPAAKRPRAKPRAR
jgi:hypothetical protein